MRSRLFLVFVSMLGCVSLAYAQVQIDSYFDNHVPAKTEYSGLKGSFAPILMNQIRSYSFDNRLEFIMLPDAPKSGIDCNNKTPQGFALKPVTLGIIGSYISKQAVCNDLTAAGSTLDSDKRFSQERCEQLISCNQVMSTKDTLTADVAKIIPEIITEDYIAEKIEDNIEKMMQLEKVRKFAEKKIYGASVTSSCTPRFLNSDPARCRTSLVDQGFIRLQKFCSTANSYCFRDQKDYLAIADLKSSEDGSSQFNLMINNRIDNSVNESLANDEELIANLGQIFSKEDTLENKKSSANDFLEKFKNEGKLDPISTYTQEKARLRALIEIMAKGKFNTAQIRKSLEEFRRDAARVILNDCEKSFSFEKLCKGATDLRKSHKSFVFERILMASRIRTEDQNERMEKLKSIFPNVIKDKHDYEMMMDAYRCKAFMFSSSETANHINYLYSEFKRVPELEKLLSNVSIDGGLRRESVATSIYSPSSPRIDEIRRGDNTPVFSVGDNLRSLGGANTDSAPSGSAGLSVQPIKSEAQKIDTQSEKIKGYDEKGNLTHTWADGLKESSTQLNSQSASSNLSYGNNNFQGATSDLEQRSKEVQPEQKKAAMPAAEGSYYGEKLAELTKKLAQSEEGLENLKAEKIASEKAALHQKKLEEESRSIAELREQINDLKSESKKEEIRSVTNKKYRKEIEESSGEGLTSGVSTMSPGTTEDSPQATSSKVQAGISAMNAPSDNSSTSTNSLAREEGAGGTGTHKAQGTSSGGSSSGAGYENNLSLVLSKSDSLSNEKIYDKIFELKGEGFFIEEGGVVKEIRPLVLNNEIVKDKSGKPIFETIVLGDKETLAKSKKAKLEKKEKLIIKSHADLRRDQEEKLKHDPAQYMKLKKITNEVWNKKAE